MLGSGPIAAAPIADDSSGPAQYTLALDAGSFASATQSATFTILRPSDNGSFAITSQDAAFQVSRSSASGSFTLAGQDISANINAPVSAGTFAATAQSAQFKVTTQGGSGTFSAATQDWTSPERLCSARCLGLERRQSSVICRPELTCGSKSPRTPPVWTAIESSCS